MATARTFYFLICSQSSVDVDVKFFNAALFCIPLLVLHTILHSVQIFKKHKNFVSRIFWKTLGNLVFCSFDGIPKTHFSKFFGRRQMWKKIVGMRQIKYQRLQKYKLYSSLCDKLSHTDNEILCQDFILPQPWDFAMSLNWQNSVRI